jgi:hypothetical protein
MRISREIIDSLYSAKMTRKQPLEIRRGLRSTARAGTPARRGEIVGLLKAQRGADSIAPKNPAENPAEDLAENAALGA